MEPEPVRKDAPSGRALAASPVIENHVDGVGAVREPRPAQARARWGPKEHRALTVLGPGRMRLTAPTVERLERQRTNPGRPPG